MNKLTVLYRTTAVRLSALYLVLFAVCALILIFYVTAMSERMLRARTQEAVVGELASLSRSYRVGGLSSLVRTVERRARRPGANLYIIASSTGDILAGNVAALQPGVLDRDGWTRIPFSYDRYFDDNRDDPHMALAHITVLPNGMRLLVGRDLGEPERFRGLVRQALAVALGIMGAGALAIWFLIGRGALRRIDGMSAASHKIMAGDLAQRLPTSGSGDEFDRLSESLNTMLGRIEKLNEGLRQVSDSIAHDLKTPLNRLRNKAEAALAAQPGETDYRVVLEEMIAESDHLIRTFNALLMISRVEAGAQAAELNPIDLSAIAADAVELYEPVAEESATRIVADITPDIRVMGNRELIGQALSNLIDNAIKYAGGDEVEGGEAEVRIGLRKERDEIVLSVADNGPGVPREHQEEVLKRFVRLDKSRSKPGTGLGLSLVNAVVALHGGRLELKNAERDMSGLTVSMVFPAREGAK